MSKYVNYYEALKAMGATKVWSTAPRVEATLYFTLTNEVRGKKEKIKTNENSVGVWCNMDELFKQPSSYDVQAGRYSVTAPLSVLVSTRMV